MARPDVRVAAVRVMQQLLTGGGSLGRLLPTAQQQVAEADRALLQNLCFGLSRWSFQLRALVDALLQKPLKQKDLDVYLLLQLGLYQLIHSHMAAHAAVDTAVKSSRALGKPWARGLVNAVLRNYQRHSDELHAALAPAAAAAHPQWLLDMLQNDWPAHWQDLVDAGNHQAVMTIRVNQRRIGTDAYRQRLADAGMQAQAIAGLPAALVLDKPVPVERLPGFTNGDASVQDGAAQFAAQLLQPQAAGARLLDACAAPGGKTAHALELHDWAGLVALDHDETRLQRARDTLARLQLPASTEFICCDAVNTDAWWDGQAFDAILLDAPCSGSGVIRRHPDIKLLRRESDIAELAAVQQALLDALWQVLKKGGQLLYATCSVLKTENEQQVEAFLARHVDATMLSIDLPFGQVRPFGVQLLSGEQGMDGFYYALLQKRA